jgi:hypothetical protein
LIFGGLADFRVFSHTIFRRKAAKSGEGVDQEKLKAECDRKAKERVAKAVIPEPILQNLTAQPAFQLMAKLYVRLMSPSPEMRKELEARFRLLFEEYRFLPIPDRIKHHISMGMWALLDFAKVEDVFGYFMKAMQRRLQRSIPKSRLPDHKPKKGQRAKPDPNRVCWARAKPGESEEERSIRVGHILARQRIGHFINEFIRRELLQLQYEHIKLNKLPISNPPPFVYFWFDTRMDFALAKAAYNEAVLGLPRRPVDEIEVDMAPFLTGIL